VKQIIRNLAFLLSISILLFAGCDSPSSDTLITPNDPSDSTRTRTPNPSRQPQEPIELYPEAARTTYWDSTGLTPQDITCDMAEMLQLYDPFEAGNSWVYSRTREDDNGTSSDYLYRRVILDHVIEPLYYFSTRSAQTLHYVRYGAEISRIYHHHNSFGAMNNFYHPYVTANRIDWSFYCFCAAAQGDTIRFRRQVVEGVQVRTELVKVLGWNETVVLPDTTYEGCYSVVIDTLIQEDTLSYHRRIANYYAPGVGLIKQVDELDSAGIQGTTILEYKPPRTWPWYHILPTEPGPPGEAILRYFPMNEGRHWDYLMSGDWTDSTLVRRRYLAPLPEGEYFRYRREDYRTLWRDSSEVEQAIPTIDDFTYNGNLPLQLTGDNHWKAIKTFLDFPNVQPGQVLYDSLRSSGIYQYSEQVSVVSVGETVTVPAGTFADVFVFRVSISSGGGMYSTNRDERLSYAPGVGLIRIHATGFNSIEYYTEDWVLLSYSAGVGGD